MPQNLLAALKQLTADFRVRDIDLIILPMVGNPHFSAHKLVDGIEADQDYFSGWTKMMIETPKWHE